SAPWLYPRGAQICHATVRRSSPGSQIYLRHAVWTFRPYVSAGPQVVEYAVDQYARQAPPAEGEHPRHYSYFDSSLRGRRL
ncbi:unnamed protein product, partial [Mycena citricolor]